MDILPIDVRHDHLFPFPSIRHGGLGDADPDIESLALHEAQGVLPAHDGDGIEGGGVIGVEKDGDGVGE